MTERWPQFNIKKDIELINAGTHFWCKACQVARPLSEKSPDPRYCQGCYELLLKETELEGGRRAGEWRPKKGKRLADSCTGSILTIDNSASSNNAGCDTVAHEVLHGAQGVTDLVTDRIKVLVGRGMSCRAIEKELLKDNITVSYRTIARRLKGQGVLV